MLCWELIYPWLVLCGNAVSCRRRKRNISIQDTLLLGECMYPCLILLWFGSELWAWRTKRPDYGYPLKSVLVDTYLCLRFHGFEWRWPWSIFNVSNVDIFCSGRIYVSMLGIACFHSVAWVDKPNILVIDTMVAAGDAAGWRLAEELSDDRMIVIQQRWVSEWECKDND